MSAHDCLVGRFDRLLERLMQGGVVPFLGAGVSVSARTRTRNDLEPTIGWLTARLGQRLSAAPEWSGLGGSLSARPQLALRGVLEAWQGGGADEGPLKLAGSLSFDRLVEVCTWLWGHAQVCKTLRIEEFADLEPRPAHRYLACLVREGLVAEVITTNYDCCIERAYADSFGESLRDEVLVIRDLDEYRQKGGRLLHDGRRRAALRLYKINGCAQRLRDNGNAEGIVLTERQLQSFGERRWVADLFRDRARCRSLLFSGFGSEEPQVRHLALALTDEFSQGDSPVHPDSTPEEIVALPNAPFLAAYDVPSFPQLQIMAGFVAPYCRRSDHEPEAPKPGNVGLGLWNVFDGCDGPALGSTEGPRLSADLFFMRLYQLAFRRLVERELHADGELGRWLGGCSDYPGRWRSYLRSRLFPDAGAQAFDACHCEVREGGRAAAQCPLPTRRPDPDGVPEHGLPAHYFGTWRCLLEVPLAMDAPPRPLPLWCWLWAMAHPERAAAAPEHLYWPIRDGAPFVLVTLLLAAALVPPPGWGRPVAVECGEAQAGEEAGVLECPLRTVTMETGRGLVVEQPSREGREPASSGGAQRASVTLVHPQGVPRLGGGGDGDSRFQRIVVVPELGYAHHRFRWEQVTGSAEGTGPSRLRLGQREAVSATAVVREARGPEDLWSALGRVYAAARPPRANVRLRRLGTSNGGRR